jgi:hypothetical protein
MLTPRSPSTDIEILLREEGGDDRPISELASSQGLESLLTALGRVVLDEDLAYTCRLPAAAHWPRDLELDDGAVLGALLVDVLFDLCRIC